MTGTAQGTQVAAVREFERDARQTAVCGNGQRPDNAGVGQTADPARIGLQANGKRRRTYLVGCDQNAQGNVRARGVIAGCPDLGAAAATQQALETEAPGQFHPRRELCHAVWQSARTVTG